MEVTVFNRLEQKVEDVLVMLEAQREEIATLSDRLAEKDKVIADLEQKIEEYNLQRDQVRIRVESLVQKMESNL